MGRKKKSSIPLQVNSKRMNIKVSFKDAVRLAEIIGNLPAGDPFVRGFLSMLDKSIARMEDPDSISELDYRSMTKGELSREARRRSLKKGMHHCHCMPTRENEGKEMVRWWRDIRGNDITEHFVQGPRGYCHDCGGTGWSY